MTGPRTVEKRILAERYRQACEMPSDINEHLPTFVRLCDTLAARTVIELGTRGGVSTVAWLYALRNGGHLWSVDLDAPPQLPSGHWTFVQGDDCDPDIVKRLPTRADVVFIDTSHAYEHTARELSIYRWRVRPGGRIVLHDTELRQPFGLRGQPPFPVRKAVEEFCAAETLEWSNVPNNNGLGIIEITE